jgi:large subunit ribosomal protein L27e
VIIQPQDNGTKTHSYPHAIVAGIERYPTKVTRRMSKKRQAKVSKVKPFIKVINYNHLMPTRYTLELEGLKGAVTSDTFKEVSQREDAKKTVKKTLEERYTSGKNRWFFTPLSMSPKYPFVQTLARDIRKLLDHLLTTFRILNDLYLSGVRHGVSHSIAHL